MFVLFNLNSSLVLGDSPPPIPASYYGTIIIDGEPAIPITHLASCINGVGRGSIVTTEEGTYGQAAGDKLMTIGTSAEDDNEIVYFCVENKRSNESITWSSGDIQKIDLTFTNRIDGCPACFVNWDCTQWSSCQENEIGEYTQTCTGNWVDLNSCETNFEKPGSEERKCQSDDDNGDGDSNEGSNSGGGGILTNDNATEEDTITDEPVVPVPDDIKEISSQPTIVEENDKVSFRFKESKISNIKITFKDQVENPSLTLEMSDNKPEATTEVSDNKFVYKYFSINKNFNSSKIAGVIIEFNVESKWLAKNNVYPEDVLLLHFNGKKWKELDTKLTGLKINSYTFEAETDSFSYFAIVAKKRGKINYIYVIVILIIIILALLVVTFIKKKKIKINKKSKKKIRKKQLQNKRKK
jgi:PGF-pre-PGF domain-containing protein